VNLLRLPNLIFGSDQESMVSSILVGETGRQIPMDNFQGQFSIVSEREEFYYLIRDRLGINKLFYNIDTSTDTLFVANSAAEFSGIVRDFNQVFSVPPGCYLKVNSRTGTKELINYYDISRVENAAAGDFDFQEFAQNARLALDRFFATLNQRLRESQFVVCLSGGLDSTIIASFAKKHLDRVVAASFSYGSPAESANGPSRSEDFCSASRIAAALQLPFIPIIKEKRMDPETLNEVLRGCQDWRDFNVHCAWLNHQIAKEMRRQFPDDHLVFLTGDLMNEFVADYTPVVYRGTTYYPQPKISRDRLRRFFVYGLDTSDREVGIFHREGITTVQPFSILAEAYLQVPKDVIELPNCKELLNLPLIENPEIGSLIVKTKVRAQVGGSDGGTLGVFHDNGITSEKLKTRWDALFHAGSHESPDTPFIISGRYRS
jgi:asparagine synthetase B (glutamine-hydrolysing)